MSQIDRKEISITTQAGTEKKYIISKVPYLSGGREICTQFVPTATPKIGDYEANEKLAVKMFSHISVILSDGQELALTTPDLVSNHVPDFLTGFKLEGAMLEHNMGFSVIEKVSGFLQALTEIMKQQITKTLMESPAQSSKKAAPRSKN